jgi:hypothetical protein
MDCVSPAARSAGSCALRGWSFRRAETIVAIHPTMARRLVALGVPEAKIWVMENWAPAGILPMPHAANPLRRAWGLEDRFVVGYSGNLGRVHDPAGVIDLVRRTAGRGVTWLFIGGGAGMAELARVLEAEKLPDVLFRPYQPRERLAESLSVADPHLVSLDPAFEGLVWPSKIYGIEAAGRPWIRLRPGLEVEDLREAARRTPRPRSDRPGLEVWLGLLGVSRKAPSMPGEASVGAGNASRFFHRSS